MKEVVGCFANTSWIVVLVCILQLHFDFSGVRANKLGIDT